MHSPVSRNGFDTQSDVYKMLQDYVEPVSEPKQSGSFKYLQGILEAEDGGRDVCVAVFLVMLTCVWRWRKTACKLQPTSSVLFSQGQEEYCLWYIKAEATISIMATKSAEISSFYFYLKISFSKVDLAKTLSGINKKQMVTNRKYKRRQNTINKYRDTFQKQKQLGEPGKLTRTSSGICL